MSRFIKEQYFFIDSEHLSEIQPAFFGYLVNEHGIYDKTNADLSALREMDGIGCYILIYRENGDIIIRQDPNGSYGLYLFRNEGYFALSNSFLYLAEHLKGRFPLTFDREFADSLLLMDLVSLSETRTPIREITILPKDELVRISPEKEVTTERIDPLEHTIPLDSPEALPILDAWFEKWTGIFRDLYSHTKRIQADLSGGFDSRLTFLLLLCSGIDPNSIYVKSINRPGVHCYSEDYEIASRIADKYGFSLNHNWTDNVFYNFSLEEIMDAILYSRINLHKEFHYITAKHLRKGFIVSGSCGESMRAYWTYTPDSFLQKYIRRSCVYPSKELRDRLTDSVTKVLSEECARAQEACRIEDSTSVDIPSAVYRRARAKNHFGLGYAENMFANLYLISPLSDPALLRLKPSSSACRDENLLYALIFKRYLPELLDFPFEGRRSIAPETILAAKTLSDTCPYVRSASTEPGPFVMPKDDTLETQQNELIRPQAEQSFLQAVFNSEAFVEAVIEEYPLSVLLEAKDFSETQNFQPLKKYFPLLCLILTKKLLKEEPCTTNFYKYLAEMADPEHAQNDFISRLLTCCMNELKECKTTPAAPKKAPAAPKKAPAAPKKAPAAAKVTPFMPEKGPLRKFRRKVHKAAILWGTKGTGGLCRIIFKKIRKNSSRSD